MKEIEFMGKKGIWLAECVDAERGFSTFFLETVSRKVYRVSFSWKGTILTRDFFYNNGVPLSDMLQISFYRTGWNHLVPLEEQEKLASGI